MANLAQGGAGMQALWHHHPSEYWGRRMNTYGFLDHDGKFGAIWYESGDDISVYLPHKSNGIFTTNLDHWHRYSDYVGTASDLADYSPEINAAALVASQNNVYIKKSTIQPLTLEPGKYHPRVWRGIPSRNAFDSGYNGMAISEDDHRVYIESSHAAASLFEELSSLFRVIEPNPTNDCCFGHKVRELIILACTEVETCWRGVMSGNRSTPKRSYSTKDYVKLLPLLRLDEWSVKLKNYPSYPVIYPFKGWSAEEGETTKSLGWYDSYNAVKHDREGEFEKATLHTLISALGAVHIMLVAQWGPELFHRFLGNRFSVFETVSIPKYDPESQYICVPAGVFPIVAAPFFG
ncbi:hypothetical protein [Pseudomonas fluorescens]|uniref:hypothetical protein n=1 Tax=Pseudomonas fluorescens TaxID=294 RepID=UPI001639F6D0|nr:hypothetical protein [Pseudomonas fluorescens]